MYAGADDNASDAATDDHHAYAASADADDAADADDGSGDNDSKPKRALKSLAELKQFVSGIETNRDWNFQFWMFVITQAHPRELGFNCQSILEMQTSDIAISTKFLMNNN